MKFQRIKFFPAIAGLMALGFMALMSVSLLAQGQYNGQYPQNQYPQNQPPQGQYSNDQGQYSDDQNGGDPPGRVARLGFVGGNVSFQPSGEDDWSQALPNYPLTTGDRIYTDRDGRAELETGNIAIRLSADTDVAATNLSDQLVQLGLAQGMMRVRAYDILQGNSVEIDTPNAALTLLRPGSYRVETYPDNYTTLVTVNSGDLEISGNGFSQVIHSGQSVKLSGDDQVQMSWLRPQGDDEFDRWCSDRDRRFLSSTSRQYVGAYVPGYDDLDQYGSWQPAAEYGQVWYPSSVPADWAPYRYGRWAWVEPWGWTWVEDEPWGFAPFHYGRWALIGSRWGWVPGSLVVGVRPVYAPALVAFVGGPNANVQVWFPLGPRDPYLPWYHHSDVYLRQVNVTNVRTQVNIVNVINVRNVNQIHYAYQRVAPTAVSTETFRGSRPVAREVVRVDVNQIGRAQVIAHPEIHPDARAIRAGAPAAHPPVERTRPRIENRPAPAANGNNNDRMRSPQRGGQPPSFQGRGPDNNRPQGNPANQNPADRSGQVQNGRIPPPGGGPVTDVNRNQNNPPSDHIHAGQQPDNNAPRRENTLPAQAPRQDQQNGQNGQNRPENENARRPQPGQNQNPSAAQEGGQNPRPGQNPPPANADNGRNNSGRDNSGRDNFDRNNGSRNGDNNNNDQSRGRSGPPQNSGEQQNGRPNFGQQGNGQQSVGQQNNAQQNNGRSNNGPPNGGQPNNGSQQQQRPLVTNNPAPQQNPSFSQRQPAMQEHPGRPLEPQQMDNVRRGQPAGQQQDREVPEHRNATPPPQQSQQQQRQQPPPQQKQQNQSHDGKDKDKDKDKPK